MRNRRGRPTLGRRCQAIPNGTRSSTRRRSWTRAAASSSPSSRERSPWPRVKAGETPTVIRRWRSRSRRREKPPCPRTTSSARSPKGTGEASDADQIETVRLRGLRPGRRGPADRGTDRQPQPHRRGHQARVHQVRRQPRRAWLGLLPVRQARRNHGRRQPLRRGRPDAGDRRRRGGHRARRRRARGDHRARRSAGSPRARWRRPRSRSRAPTSPSVLARACRSERPTRPA